MTLPISLIILTSNKRTSSNAYGINPSASIPVDSQSLPFPGHNEKNTARFEKCEGPTAAFLKFQVFWNVTQCRSVNTYRTFEGFYFSHLQRQAVKDK